MNVHSIVIIVLRLMALVLAIRVGTDVAPLLFTASDVSGALPALLVIGLLVAAVLLWTFARPISRWVADGASHEISFGAMSLADCYSIAFMGAGLYYLVSELPQVLHWGQYLFRHAASTSEREWAERAPWRQVWQAFAVFIIGGVLFTNARRWAAALARREQRTPPRKQE